ncbi:MAG: DUF5050 domain-containing protein [Lachnospiraceae bacterium]|nr:DUF5050 domain-containing protein [Lachnospiraceae bacterium]
MAAIRCIGCLALAVFILFLSVLVGKYALTLLIAVAVTLLPYLALTSNQIHHLPLPLAFLMAADFFKGTVISSDSLTGEEIVLFQEVGRGELQILIGILLFAAIGMLLWVRRKTANQWNKRSKRMGYRSLAGLLCVLTLSGCAIQPAEQRGITAYNSSSDFGIHGYEMIFDDENRPAYLQNLSSEEKIVLDRSPFVETTNAGTIHSIFYQGNDVYYLKTKTESYIDRVGVYNSTADIVSITRLDTQTLEETVIWEQIISTGRSILGIEYEVSDQWSFLTKYSKFFLDGSSLFFICDSNIRKIDRKTNQISIIDIYANKNIAFDGKNIFYLNQFSKLTKYDTQAALETEIAGVVAENFFLTEEKIFFINRMDNYKIYSCNLDGNKQEKVTDAPAIYITVKGQSIFYTDKRDGQQYSICLTDSNCSPKKVG